MKEMGIDDPTPEALADYIEKNLDRITEKTLDEAKETLKEVGLEPTEENIKRYQAGYDQFLRTHKDGATFDMTRIKKAVRALRASGNNKPSFEDVDKYLDNLEKIEAESAKTDDKIDESEELKEEVPEEEVKAAMKRFKEAKGHDPTPEELGDFMTLEDERNNVIPPLTEEDIGDRYNFMSVRKAVKSLKL